MLNSDILGYIFLKIDDPQTLLRFAQCSKNTLTIARKFSDIKRKDLTKITTTMRFAIPQYNMIRTEFPSGWCETRNSLGQLYECGKMKNGLKQNIWKTWDLYGNLIGEIMYVDDVRHGSCKIWSTTDDGKQGNLMKGQFNKGEAHGLYSGTWFPLYFAWFINGKHEFLVIGIIKSFVSYIKSFFLPQFHQLLG